MKKVEKFRLSKEQLSWMKEVKKVEQVQDVLTKGVLQDWLKKGENLKRAFGQLGQKRKMLQMVAPREKIEEIPGQGAEERGESAELFEGNEGLGQRQNQGFVQ